MENHTVTIMPKPNKAITNQSKLLNTDPVLTAAAAVAATALVAAVTLLVISFKVFLFFQSDYSALNL
jgi:ABC-type uncharacterized transport system permease subunit